MTHIYCNLQVTLQEQQCVALVDLQIDISFLFPRCHYMQPCYGVDPSIGLNYTRAVRAGTVVCPTAAAAADTLLCNLLIKN